MTPSVSKTHAKSFLRTALLTVALTSTFGLVASAGRAYLVAVAAMFVSLCAAQVVAASALASGLPGQSPRSLAA